MMMMMMMMMMKMMMMMMIFLFKPQLFRHKLGLQFQAKTAATEVSLTSLGAC